MEPNTKNLLDIISNIIIPIKGKDNQAPILPIASNIFSNLELIFNNVLAIKYSSCEILEIICD